VSVLEQICTQSTSATDNPQAASIEKDIPIYDATHFNLNDTQTISDLQDELHHTLLSGAGVFVLQNMYTDDDPINTANTAFQTIITHERTSKKGDHFSPKGKNDRIWNSLGKHCLTDPTSFIAYYSNPWLSLISESWLGPAYRLTAQLNIVNPGGAPQVSHRDYHLGFQTEDACSQFPQTAQVASQFLTLQGAVAHSDMPLASGPTRFLPFSQRFAQGYMAYRLPEFVRFFDQRWVSVALRKGDAVFFNPALFHAAGENGTRDVRRSANLLQVSSAFGRTMEGLDTLGMVAACWCVLRGKFEREGWSREVECCVKAVGDGYPFPTNLDRRPPAPGGMAPEDEQGLLRRALEDGWSTDEVVEALRQMKLDSHA